MEPCGTSFRFGLSVRDRTIRAECDASRSLPPELWVLLDSNRIGQTTEPAIRGEQGLRPGLRHSCNLDVDGPHHLPRTGQLARKETRLASVGFAERQELVPSRELGEGSPLREAQDDVAETLIGPLSSFQSVVGRLRNRDGFCGHVCVHMHAYTINLLEGEVKQCLTPWPEVVHDATACRE